MLAGGSSHRLGRPKAFVEVAGVPLVVRVIVAIGEIADELVVVTRGDLVTRIERLLPAVRVVRDQSRIRSPLVGLMAGASALSGDYVAALPCDLPFIVPALLRRLFSAANRKDAAIPRWPNGMIEPLLAVYARRPLLRTARLSLEAGDRSLHSVIDRLPNVRFVDVEGLRHADPTLVSFTNVNTPADLRRARRMATRLGRPPRRR